MDGTILNGVIRVTKRVIKVLGFIGAIAFINTQTKCDRHYKQSGQMQLYQ
jgi:hypothetical protein